MQSVRLNIASIVRIDETRAGETTFCRDHAGPFAADPLYLEASL